MTQTENKNIAEVEILFSKVAMRIHMDAESEGIAGATNPSVPVVNPCGGLDELDLQTLIARIVNQDQSAFSALFKAMSVRVNSIALRITASAQLAEEVTEDTFFQIWRQAPRFDPSRGTATAWILTIARSRALDARRSIPPFDELPEFETEENRDYQHHGDLPDLLSVVEQNQSLHCALKTLEPLPRQLIALSYFRGLSHEEIAGQVKLPLGTVKSHLRRAVIHLREVLITPSIAT